MKTWQPLSEHLRSVASMARDFAARFGAGDVAWATGLYHDIGKYSSEFQRRLLDSRIRVDHSTAGASVVFEKFGPLGRLMAYTIAGHHSGLPNGGGAEESDLFYRVRHKKLAEFGSYSSEITHSGEVHLPSLRPQENNRRGFTLAFFTRMLFSCLTDADCLDAEAFGDPKTAGLRGPWGPLESLEGRLTERIREITSTASCSLVNDKRGEVLCDCLTAAQKPRGLFTLTVPTGGAKTLSSLAFALKHARLHGLTRVIYVIPFTSIIEQNADVFRKALGDNVVLEHHSNVAPPEGRSDVWRTPLALAEENWDAPVVVTTNVQFFESLYSSRPSRCRKLHNIANSVVILDEAQMLPVELLRPCVAAVCELVNNYGTTVVLCSATQPALEDLIPVCIRVREIARDPKALYCALKRVIVHDIGVVTNEAIVAHLRQREQVMCIVNTRAHAREVFQLLGKGDGHYHLSAAMYPRHRHQCLQEIRNRLQEGLPCRVVSTQLIEAGVDVDFPVVLRAIAGLDSIAQAAGRCNREGKSKCGQVYVFSPAEGEGMSHLWFKRTAAIAAGIMKHECDPLSLGAINQYFRQLYFYERGAVLGSGASDGLDRHNILGRFETGAKSLDFPFREVEQLFKVIGDETVGVVVPGDLGCQTTLEEVRLFGISRIRARRLQQYMVSVRTWELGQLQNAGLLEEVGGLPVLWDLSSYHDLYGLGVGSSTKEGDDAWIY